MAIVLTSADKSVVSESGGELLSVAGTFPAGEDLAVHFGPLGTVGDPPCYGGQGWGYSPQSADGSTLVIVLPPGAVGAATLTVDHPVEGTDTLAGFSVVVRSYAQSVHSIRQAFPRWVGVGSRRLDGEE